ncbi:sulfite exporter TauE/SafE family protein [Variovorax ginsengisoli]|uniref:Probable membrane transporter protein n=1 Tax=Variovorax ginsengisoli TaxID=363844 RepID=A0ABT9S6I1_9BURK|nr:sulfite exporter TauE/SafE family protein [Variovorax ginsengisoli]MDP9899463.1 putative membrane protein YfcA [Variovorax ginsengisoli]
MLLGTLFGLAIGLVLGLTGAGGGILAVPALVIGLGWSLPQATPVALLAVGLAAALGAVDGLRKGLVRWRAALLMATLGVLFSPLGVHAAHVLPQKTLMTLFAIAMLAASTRPLLQGRASANDGAGQQALEKNCMLSPQTGRLRWTRRCAMTLAGIGSVSGLLTGMLGVGGGFLIVPAFRQWTDIRMHSVVATSLLVVALVSIGATFSALGAGAHISRVGAFFIGASMIGMACGRVTAPHLPGPRLQVGFALLSAGVALFLLGRTWA